MLDMLIETLSEKWKWRWEKQLAAGVKYFHGGLCKAKPRKTAGATTEEVINSANGRGGEFLATKIREQFEVEANANESFHGVGFTNMWEMQLSNASRMYWSGSTSLALGTVARTLLASGTGVGCIVGYICWFAPEGSEAVVWKASLACFVDCELPLVSGPRGRGCTRRFSWQPQDLDFREALGGRPSRVARGMLHGCTAGSATSWPQRPAGIRFWKL